MNIKKNTLNITVYPVVDLKDKDGKEKKNTCKRFFYLLFCIGSVGLSVLLFSCEQVTLGDKEWPTPEYHPIGILTGTAFISDYTFTTSVGGTASPTVDYYIDFIDNGSRWMSKDPFDSTDAFEIVFPDYYDYNVDVKINGYLDPFDDNSPGGAIQLYAVFPSGAPESKQDSLPGERNLYIDSGGKLKYEIKYSDPDDTYPTTFFMMKNQSFKAGDDFVINFKTYNAGEFTEFDSEINDFIDFFGVIDKEFLDEANLYIKEASNDWNGDEQMSIRPFTWHNRSLVDSENSEIENAVAYSVNAQDSPVEFNDKMDQQKEFLSVIRDYKGYTNFWYGDTRAPGETGNYSMWGYYVRSENIQNDFGISEAEVSNTIDTFEFPEGSGEFPLNELRPYSPGFSSLPNVGDDYFLAGQSAGVDCIGLIQRSLSYTGNPYDSKLQLGEHPWTWYNGDYYIEGSALYYAWNRHTLFYDNDNELLKPYSAFLDKVTNWDEEELEKILLGDIFYYYRQHPVTLVWSYHAAIVDRVEYEDWYSNRSDIKYEDIMLIEATWWPDPVIGSVVNTRTLETYKNLGREWRFGRLKQ